MEKTTTKTTTASKSETLAKADTIGHALTAESKWDTAKAMHDTTKNEVVKECLSVYLAANRKAVNPKHFKGISAAAGTMDELYSAAMLKLYVSAIQLVDASTADYKKADNAVYTALKEYFALYAVENLAPARTDTNKLLAYITGTTTAGINYYRHTNDNGEISIRIKDGITAESAKSYTAFSRAVERLTAERILGFDGVLSRVAARAVRDANKAKRDALKPVEEGTATLEPAAAENTAA